MPWPSSNAPCGMQSHHRLFAWQKANASAVAIHRLCVEAWTPPHAVVMDQLRRASLSVPLNLAEGHALGRGARCRYHARIAYGSAVETTELLEFLAALGLQRPVLIALSREVQAITLRLLRSLR